MMLEKLDASAAVKIAIDRRRDGRQPADRR